MVYDAILGWLNKFNLVAWAMAAVVSYFVQKYIKNKGWTTIMIGSLFVVVRQLWKVLFKVSYNAAGSSDVVFNMYMGRYVFGAIGALLISIGLLQLIINYFVVKSQLEGA